MEDIENELVCFDLAKLAKEKGFIGRCSHYYILEYAQFEPDYVLKKYTLPSDIESNFVLNYVKGSKSQPHIASAPSLSQLQKWLREEYSIHITVFSKSQESWMYRITTKGQSLEEGLYDEDFNTYEEALEQGLLESLKLLEDEENNS